MSLRFLLKKGVSKTLISYTSHVRCCFFKVLVPFLFSFPLSKGYSNPKPFGPIHSSQVGLSILLVYGLP